MLVTWVVTNVAAVVVTTGVITYGEDIVFIDFQDVGRGHVFEDFVAMESSIRLFFEGRGSALSKSSAALLKMERELWRGKVARSASSRLVERVRQAAWSRFPDVAKWEYAYAVAAISFRLHRLAGIDRARLSRLTAATIAAVEYLEEACNK